MELQQELKEYLLREHLRGEDPDFLGEDLDLIGSGILDSLAIMKLVLHLQQHYGLEMQPSEILPENLGTLRRLAEFVARGRAA